jgi:type II secretion system protein C
MASFLQRVVVEPSIDGGRFEGFRILALQPENFWRGVDLHAGDVVTSVNGQSIEQPEAAFTVFESLRTAKELSVTVVRDGETKQLVFPIAGPPRPKEPAAAEQG